LQYTLRSTNNYLQTAEKFTTQFHALVINEPPPSLEMSGLLDKLQSFSEKGKETLAKLAAEYQSHLSHGRFL
jgi:hypothetical protein